MTLMRLKKQTLLSIQILILICIFSLQMHASDNTGDFLKKSLLHNVCNDAVEPISGNWIADYQLKNGFRERIPNDRYVQSFKKLSLSNQSIQANGHQINFTKQLGRGYRGEVFLAENGSAYKIPKKAADSIALEVESMVAKDLDQHYSEYKILTEPILEIGENGSYLKKGLISADKMASHILKEQNGILTPEQSAALKDVFEGAQKYARDKQIGIDLKSENLYWNGKTWVLFDTGPRTSYLPFGYTSDLSSFEQYLTLWTHSEPVP